MSRLKKKKNNEGRQRHAWDAEVTQEQKDGFVGLPGASVHAILLERKGVLQA